MATIINNPDSGSGGGNGGGAGLIIGVVVAIIVIALFFIYALPAIRNTRSGDTTIKVPDKIDVNVNQPQNNGY